MATKWKSLDLNMKLEIHLYAVGCSCKSETGRQYGLLHNVHHSENKIQTAVLCDPHPLK